LHCQLDETDCFSRITESRPDRQGA